MTGRSLVRAIAARERVFACLAAAALGLALLWSGVGSDLEQASQDLRSGFATHRASGNVTVVEIDGRSIAAYRRWPWPRSIHARLVDRLHSAGAKLIAFDVDFSSPSDAAGDGALAAALQRADRAVLLPTFRQDAAFGDGDTLESAPIPALAANAFLVAANVRPDSDGQLRKMPYALAILGAPRPSLAAMVAERQGQAGASYGIDLHLDPASIPRFSAVDVAEGRVPAAALRGKRVIVGGTAVELGDRYSVPGHGILPGVVVQAMAAETLLAGRGYGEASGLWPLIAAVALLALALIPRATMPRAVLVAAAAAALLFLPLAGERFAGVTLPVVPALAALLAGAAAAAGRAMATRYGARGLVDRETGLANLSALTADAAGLEDVTIGVVRIERAAERVSTGGAGEIKASLLRLARRLEFAASPRIYRVDTGALAWLMPAATSGEDPLPAIAHLLRAAAAGEGDQDVQLHFGAASGAGRDAAALAASAALAAGQAAAEGVASHVFTEADGELVRRQESLLGQFDRALAEGHITVAYQPKRDLASGRTKGVEALARWHDPVLGTVAPDIFIPLLERHGRIADLTAFVLAEALEAVKVWGRRDPDFSVAVNVSAALLHDAGPMLRLKQVFLASGAPAHALVIEVTETAAMGDTDRAVASLEAWRAIGAAVSIDDYGTGHSSLAYLQSLPATEIKIDGSFVRGLAADQRSAIMVKSTIAMAHELGLEVVAEGVEDEHTLALLRGMGCDTAQGYVIARPMPAEAIAELLAGETSAAA